MSFTHLFPDPPPRTNLTATTVTHTILNRHHCIRSRIFHKTHILLLTKCITKNISTRCVLTNHHGRSQDLPYLRVSGPWWRVRNIDKVHAWCHVMTKVGKNNKNTNIETCVWVIFDHSRWHTLHSGTSLLLLHQTGRYKWSDTALIYPDKNALGGVIGWMSLSRLSGIQCYNMGHNGHGII